ncbi:MAG: ABC transporter permease [Pseudomonadota bacterium]
MSPRLRRLRALVRKEAVQIVRDPSSLLIAVAMPLILLFLFGFGLSLDANTVRIGLVVERPGAAAERLAAAFEASRYFEVTRVADRRAVADDLLAERLRGLVVIPAEFGQRWAQDADRARIQVIADGSEPNTARFVHNYSRGVYRTWRAQELGTAPPPVELEPRFWFNPELRSRNFLVPGSIGVIMTLIGTLLTALVVAREWERGTMEALFATPIGTVDLLLGKLIPYYVLAMASMAICTLLAVFLFQVPLRGSIFALALVSTVFLVPALGQGLLISAAAKNQFVASQFALLSAFLPAFLLSGFVFEIESMPVVIQYVTYAIPARYLIPSLQTIFLAGDVWPLLWRNMAAMLAIGAVFLGLALTLTRKRLD